jgi:hypothetical protein
LENEEQSTLSRWVEAAAMFATGLKASEIAAALEVNERTVRKWLAKARAMGKDVPAEGLVIPATSSEALAMVTLAIRREIAAIDSASQRQPGTHSHALLRLSKALAILPEVETSDDGPPIEEVRAELLRKLNGDQAQREADPEQRAESLLHLRSEVARLEAMGDGEPDIAAIIKDRQHTPSPPVEG